MKWQRSQNIVEIAVVVKFSFVFKITHAEFFMHRYSNLKQLHFN